MIKKKCPAQAALTDEEAHWLNKLPDALHHADDQPMFCEFATHAAGTRHAYIAQDQCPDNGKITTWWLVWNNSGFRELRIGQECGRITNGEGCLFLLDHPGACDNDPNGIFQMLRDALG